MNTHTPETLTAEFLRDIPLSTAIAAHNGTSWTPEKRGESTRNEYASTLAADYMAFAAVVAQKPELANLFLEEFERYRDGFRKRYLAMLHSRSRCLSSAITGPSNFPVRRNEKRNDIAHKRLTEMLDFRTEARKAIMRKLHPELRPIMAGDEDACEALKAKIEAAEARHAQMKAINVAHKRFLKDPDTLDTCGLSDELKDQIRRYVPRYSWEPHPIAPFEFQNHGANIRRLKERLEQITQAKATPTTVTEGPNDCGIRIEDCPAENRVRLFFPGKPDADVRTRLKSGGFRWAPTLGCWQAYRNWRTLELANKEAGVAEVTPQPEGVTVHAGGISAALTMAELAQCVVAAEQENGGQRP